MHARALSTSQHGTSLTRCQAPRIQKPSTLQRLSPRQADTHLNAAAAALNRRARQARHVPAASDTKLKESQPRVARTAPMNSTHT